MSIPPGMPKPPKEWAEALGYQVYYASMAQFILAEDLEDAIWKDEEVPLYQVVVTVPRLYVRAGSGKQFEILDTVVKGDEFPVFAQAGTWVRITADGVDPRWLHSNYVAQIE